MFIFLRVKPDLCGSLSLSPTRSLGCMRAYKRRRKEEARLPSIVLGSAVTLLTLVCSRFWLRVRFLSASSSGRISIFSVDSVAMRLAPLGIRCRKVFMIFKSATEVRRFCEMIITLRRGTHKISASTNTQIDHVLPKRRGVRAITW